MRLSPLSRESSLQAIVLLGSIAVLTIEAASAFQSIDRGTLLAAWAIIAACVAIYCAQLQWKIGTTPRLTLIEIGCVGAIVGIGVLVCWTALLSPPNSADAMAYHMPRIVYWVQAKSVSFFPTSYLNQIMLQPVAEYLMLHTYVLSGGDRFINLIQFGAFAGSIIGVSSIAEALGLSRAQQVYAALFCATLPNGILQASGAKNDWVLTLWLLCTALFAIRWMQRRTVPSLLFLSLSAGLALGTKGTGYLFLPFVLTGAFLASGKTREVSAREWLQCATAAIAGILLINGPQYGRNYNLSGSVIGADSAQGDGVFRWRNEPPGWKPLVSNLIRNTVEQLGSREESWNRRVYDAARHLHQLAGIDPEDPATTWRWSKWIPPRNANHEADANNRWHLLLVVIAIGAALFRRDARWLFYAIAPVGGFLAFCFYLKWQPFFSRLELPLFVIAAPLFADLLGRLRPAILQAAVCLFLISNARLALEENWTRPLTGTKSLRTTPRELAYFNDMGQWSNRQSYLDAVEKTAASGCELVGIDNKENQLEYPFQALLLRRNPRIRFVHVGVQNASVKYGIGEPAVCAVWCPDCAGIAEKHTRYSQIGAAHTIGRFLLFTR